MLVQYLPSWFWSLPISEKNIFCKSTKYPTIITFPHTLVPGKSLQETKRFVQPVVACVHEKQWLFLHIVFVCDHTTVMTFGPI